jgi:1-acyl-sn-glycerol-3-phosphate acyltransferase
MRPRALPGPAGVATNGAVVFTNLARVALSWVWTFIVGTPLVVTIYVRYGYGLARARLGRADVLDRVLEANAHLAGWVAQHLWTKVLFAVLRVPLAVRELVPVDWSKAHVVCSNHASLLDILALIRVVPPPFRFVAKRELTRWPIVGWALRPAGQIVIDRADHAQAIQSITEAALRKIRGQVIFFVEGTRSRSGQLQPFKKGAFHFAIRNRLPVLPVAVRGSYDALARLPWWRLRPGRAIEVCFCRAIEAAAVADPAEILPRVERLRSETRAAIAGALAA